MGTGEAVFVEDKITTVRIDTQAGAAAVDLPVRAALTATSPRRARYVSTASWQELDDTDLELRALGPIQVGVGEVLSTGALAVLDSCLEQHAGGTRVSLGSVAANTTRVRHEPATSPPPARLHHASSTSLIMADKMTTTLKRAARALHKYAIVSQ